MREIKAAKISQAIIELVRQANFVLRKDVLLKLKKAYSLEKNIRAKKILKAVIDNAAYAKKNNLAICQDTGMPVVFVQIGQDVKISGDLNSAINKGIDQGYKKYCLRDSIVADPILRGVSKFSPCIIHTELIRGNKIKLKILPKGFGCENKSQLKMFKPTAAIVEIKKFIIEAVKNAGPDACPPYVVGVGIGGTADYAAILAKKALLENISSVDRTSCTALETDLLKEINKLNIGPMGLGGKCTALGVKIKKYPTHIAGLPVAVNISCHALRSASIVI